MMPKAHDGGGLMPVLLNKRIKLKRAYDKPQKHDGFRVLVDRLWPRSVKKEEARIDLWLREIAPSADLRKWFQHDPEKWDGFKRRYFAELEAKDEILKPVRNELKKRTVTLVYGSKEERYNNAVALKEYLLNE